MKGGNLFFCLAEASNLKHPVSAKRQVAPTDFRFSPHRHERLGGASTVPPKTRISRKNGVQYAAVGRRRTGGKKFIWLAGAKRRQNIRRRRSGPQIRTTISFCERFGAGKRQEDDGPLSERRADEITPEGGAVTFTNVPEGVDVGVVPAKISQILAVLVGIA